MTMSFLKTLVFSVLVPGTFLIVIPRRLLGVGAQAALPFGLIGIVLIVLGAAGYLWCAWDFASTGQGTPAPIDPPKVLVAGRLYRVVRNPMYLSVLLILVGESVFFASATLLWYALLAWVIIHLFVVFYEEPTLRRKFGTAYEPYCRRVSRWVPRPSNFYKNLSP
ncbi:MAG TPA: isoprenylcysteine carboxylmethyltransferase family protein [bacterium]|nr:isoprenylcysteine carboxylmethyltransferase family protein [bacterium]